MYLDETCATLTAASVNEMWCQRARFFMLFLKKPLGTEGQKLNKCKRKSSVVGCAVVTVCVWASVDVWVGERGGTDAGRLLGARASRSKSPPA